ncbi:hypothetical protein O3P69_001627 [Scylla paramamosain]|uniref:Secreted protein n=1 Tax=Scylla paramamosain TaxID=85552 RepID=A0AAW0V3I1_SCYPA
MCSLHVIIIGLCLSGNEVDSHYLPLLLPWHRREVQYPSRGGLSPGQSYLETLHWAARPARHAPDLTSTWLAVSQGPADLLRTCGVVSRLHLYLTLVRLPLPVL